MAKAKSWRGEMRLIDGDRFGHQTRAVEGKENEKKIQKQNNHQNQHPREKQPKRRRLLATGAVLKSRWRIQHLIAEGGFGQIYKALDQENDETPVAVKAEAVEGALPLLRMEIAVLTDIHAHCETEGAWLPHFLRLHSCGHHEQANYIVMDLCGRNLMELKKATKDDQLTVGTSLRVACQMLRSLADLHRIGWLHRDVKPSNFCIGHQPANRRTVFVIDFGLCRQYMDSEGHRRPRYKCGFRGTVRYASINIHAAKDMGRVDDLWSLFYIILEQIVGQLPWRRVTEKARVKEMKENADYRHLLSRCPRSLTTMRNHLNTLDFYAAPQYTALNRQFQEDLKEAGVTEEDPMDWENTLDDGYLACVAGGEAKHKYQRPGTPCPTICEKDSQERKNEKFQ